jgi:hypothetical protein
MHPKHLASLILSTNKLITPKNETLNAATITAQSPKTASHNSQQTQQHNTSQYNKNLSTYI